MTELAQSIREGDMKGYQKLRYPSIPDGESVNFVDEDFSNVDFSEFSVGFFNFEHCNLDNTRGLYGQPITIISCSARHLDLRGVRAIIHAQDSDFRGLQIDKNTLLAYNDDSLGAKSTFTNCVIDQESINYLTSQGVVIVNRT